MKKPSKALKSVLVGVAASIIVGLLLGFRAWRSEWNLRSLEAQCRGENTDKDVQLVCDAKRLIDLQKRAGPLVGTQAQIAERSEMFDEQCRQVWLALLVIPLPWLWYFILDRIRELSSAIRGQG